MSSRLAGILNEIDPQNLQHPVLAFLKDYWDAKRGARAMPSRSDISPAEMKEHLGWVVLLDALPDYSDFRYRTIGSRVTEYFLSDSTGKTITEAFEPYGEAAVKGALWIHRKAALERVGVRAFGGADFVPRACLSHDGSGSRDDLLQNPLVGDARRSSLSPLRRTGRIRGAPPERTSPVPLPRVPEGFYHHKRNAVRKSQSPAARLSRRYRLASFDFWWVSAVTTSVLLSMMTKCLSSAKFPKPLAFLSLAFDSRRGVRTSARIAPQNTLNLGYWPD
jgi:hypothetical protein